MQQLLDGPAVSSSVTCATEHWGQLTGRKLSGEGLHSQLTDLTLTQNHTDSQLTHLTLTQNHSDSELTDLTLTFVLHVGRRWLQLTDALLKLERLLSIWSLTQI